MVAYRVEHETRYGYEARVSTSQHVAYLRPRELSRQRVFRHDLMVEPAPARSSRRTDYFGNEVEQFTVLTPHAELLVRARSFVEVDPPPRVDLEESPPWEEGREALVYAKGRSSGEPSQFAYPSPYVSFDRDLLEFARARFRPARPLLDSAFELMRRIHAEFRFDPKATTITTPVKRVFEQRSGVCQDLAHLQIACLRSLGLSARYVSGYLLTDPPPGQHRLVGADASHAWLSVHCPRHGFVDLDPTNGVLASARHVTLAWGRDFGDVSPLRGVILGGAEHVLRVGVSVVPVAADEWRRLPAEVTSPGSFTRPCDLPNE
jgi:transglutaminase-like putative cysteine protease